MWLRKDIIPLYGLKFPVDKLIEKQEGKNMHGNQLNNINLSSQINKIDHNKIPCV